MNSSGWYTATVARATPFSYLSWSLQDPVETLLAVNSPDASLGNTGYAFSTSGSAIAGSSESTFQGPCIWASTDYWYPNSEFFMDCSLAKVRLTFSSMQVRVYSTELAIAASSLSGMAPLTVSFTAAAKDGVAPYTYQWVFEGLGSSNLQNPAFAFQSPGVYTARCTTTDSVGISDTKSLTITVSSVWLSISSQGDGATSPPSGLYSKLQGEQVIVSAIPSSGSVLERWLLDGSDFGDSSQVSVIMNSNHTLNAIFAEALNVFAWASPQSGIAPLSVTFSSAANGGTPPYSFSWAFGDGGTSTNQNVTHDYLAQGSYTATLRATDSAGRSGTSAIEIDVAESSPGIIVWLTKTNDIAVPQGGSSSSIIGVFSNQPAVATITIEWVGSVPALSSTSLSKISAAVNYTSILAFSAGSSTPIGEYTLRVTASAGGATGHIDVKVDVSQSYCTLSLSSGQGGSTSPAPGTYQYPLGSTKQFTAYPSIGYAFAQWNLDGVYLSSSAQVTLLMDRSHSLSAAFYKLPTATGNTLTFEALRWNGTGWTQGGFPDLGVVLLIAGHTSISFSTPSYSYKLPLPTPFSFQFIPLCADGRLMNTTAASPVSKLFAVQAVSQSGVRSILPDRASYPNLCPVLIDRGAMVIKLMIKAKDFSVNVSSPTPAWGSVMVSSDSPGWPLYAQNYSSYSNGFGEYWVDSGCNLSINACPFNGYYLDRIVIGNQTYYSNDVEIGPIINNGSVEVIFSAVPTTFSLDISSTSGGSTLPSPGHYEVLRHSTQVISVSSIEDGFCFSGWFLDGAYASGASSIYVLMDSDHSVMAKFEDDSYMPDRLNARPCDFETGATYRKLIVGECVGINVSGRIDGVSSPTLVSISAWFSNGSASYWNAALSYNSTAGYISRADVMTDSSGYFSTVLGNVSSCWVVEDLVTGSNHSAFAEVSVHGSSILAAGSWTAERIQPKASFNYNSSGALAAITLTYSDGSPLEGRVGSYVASFEDANFGISSPNGVSGVCSLWIPYSAMEGFAYVSSNWSISLFSNISGYPSAVPSVIPSQVRFSEISCQFLMHNDTHLALQAFDWGSAGLEVIDGAYAAIWWCNRFDWADTVTMLGGELFGSSACPLIRYPDGSALIVAPDQGRWSIDTSISLGSHGEFMNGVILITHPSLSTALSERPAGSSLYLTLVPPNTSGILYCPTRSGVFLLASSIAPPHGW